MKYTRIYSDKDGITHFEDKMEKMNLNVFAPPCPEFQVSDFKKSKHFCIAKVPAGWDGGWHPAPYKQYCFFLVGAMEVKVGDGEQRIFGPGSILYLEDTKGKGHYSQIVSHEDAVIIAVQV